MPDVCAFPFDMCSVDLPRIVTAVVLGKNKSVDTPHVFATWERSTRRTKGTLPIWQVARATSAAPTIFTPMRMYHKNVIGVPYEDYVDGGVMTNNPSSEIYSEVIGHGKTVSTLVSLGTGIPKQRKKDFFKPGYFGVKVGFKRLSKQMMGFSLDGESAHEAMQSFMKSVDTEYYRFNVSLKAKMWHLDSWHSSRMSAFPELERRTEAYMQEEVKEWLRACAETLVKRRKLRKLDADRWAVFSAA